MFCGAAGVGPQEDTNRPGGLDGEGEATGARRLGREVAQALRRKGTRLVLHFDLNKTLIMVDPAGGKTQSQVQHYTAVHLVLYTCSSTNAVGRRATQVEGTTVVAVVSLRWSVE